MGMSAHYSMKASRINPWARSWNVSSNSTSSSSRTAVSGKAGRAWSTYVRGRRGSATAISIKLRPRLLNSASMKSRALAKQRLMLTGGHGFPSCNVLAGGEASEALVVVLAPVTQMEVQYFEKGLAVWSVSQHRWQLRIRPSVDSRAPKQGRGARCPRGLALPARTRWGGLRHRPVLAARCWLSLSGTRTPTDVTQDLNRTRNAPSGCFLSQR